ncbi:MAG: glutamyl-tRNA reductase [Dehalococcoidales bacterium]|nr:glutamyl-tRNA reductase [Dehalococcoidales bacterium]
MQVSLIGINHETAPIALREKAAVSSNRLEESFLLLRNYVPHGVILSTCNRTEVYVMDTEPAEEASINFLTAMTGVSFANLLPHIYLRKNKTAVEHLFSVAAGLDSMIVGEFEILGQVGHALEVAEKAEMVNLELRHIFQSAVRTGRRVRDETGISKNALSVSSVAVDLATSVVGALENCKVMVIGAGEAGSLVAKVARERGVSKIVVANRTPERAVTLAAALGGTTVSLENLAAELSTVNIVVSCVGSPQRILDISHVATAMKQRPELPLVIIDIAVPRDVEPAVTQVKNVFLYNIDDLTEISETNRQQREGETQKAREVTTAEVSKFISRWRALEVRPVVTALMEKAEEIRCAQLDKTLKKLHSLSDEERQSLDAMTKSIVTKILNDPIHYLQENADSNWDYAEIVSELFQLNQEK